MPRPLSSCSWAMYHLDCEVIIATISSLRRRLGNGISLRETLLPCTSRGSAAGSSPLAECNSDDRRILGGDEFASRLFSASLETALIQSARDKSTQRGGDGGTWIAHQAIIGRISSIAAVARPLSYDESSPRHGINPYFDSA
jgi:hypothetical protein